MLHTVFKCVILIQFFFSWIFVSHVVVSMGKTPKAASSSSTSNGSPSSSSNKSEYYFNYYYCQKLYYYYLCLIVQQSRESSWFCSITQCYRYIYQFSATLSPHFFERVRFNNPLTSVLECVLVVYSSYIILIIRFYITIDLLYG